MSGFVRIGRVVGAFGIKGQVKVAPLTDFIERFDPGRRVLADGRWLTIADYLDHSGRIVLRFEEVSDRTEAEALMNVYLEASEAERPQLDEGEYLTRDLIGCQVVTESGEDLGPLRNVLGTPAHDVFVLEKGMIPAVKEFVKDVDLGNRRIVVAPIPGMLEEEDEDVSG